MSDSRSFHDSAAKAKPNEPSKPSTYWVALLHLDKQPTGELSNDDFLWLKAHSKITAQIIRDQYEKKFAPAESWVLKHESKVVTNLKSTMSELDTYDDKIIAFEAVKASDSSRLVTTRQPLQPKTAQTFPPPPQKLAYGTDGTQDLKNSIYGAPVQYGAYVIPHPSTNNPLSPQAGLDGAPAGPRPTILGQLSGFTRFQESVVDRMRIKYSGYSEAAIQVAIRKEWEALSPAHRAQYERDATTNTNSQALQCASTTGSPMSGATNSRAPRIKAESRMDSSRSMPPSIDEPPISSTELNEQKPKTFHLQTLLNDAGPQMLEASVEQGVKLLDDLKAPLLAKLENNPDAEQWIEQIDNLRKQAVKTRTVIGVVGNTGAGKSSVINAMLDEERLVPTNCMRACTAVVTEISYNYGKEPYRAQIEFISSVEWEKELKTLFQDLLDGNGQVSRDCANEDTDAGIAYAKIKAVYPRKTKEDIANSNIATMLQEVSSILGSSRDIIETDSLLFYKKLQHFVDSKEKSTGNKDKDKKKERKEMEFWPLIRVVRINVKSSALATGAVIVDLPGVHDANAARAAVAEGYMKQCTGLWIVAPINRAVDDKAAKSLLGESFKRQLKMDGGFNSVTFICSKTDDISLEEAQDSLGLDGEMEAEWAEMDRLAKKQKALKKRLEEMKDSKAVYGEVMNDADEQIEVWDSLKEKLEEGDPVFPPKRKGATKRKCSGSKGKSSKKVRRSSSSESEDTDRSDSEDKDMNDDEEEKTSSEDETEGREPLTEDQIMAKLQEFRTQKKTARTEKLEITGKITALREEIDEAKTTAEAIESKMSALCISGRNQYSKGAIQQDFAAGIKELDQELAAEEDEENFNPDVEARDYEEVARGLPVFCVSSRGYQKLQGRLRKDPNIAGFKTIEETEIPQLQAHCEKLTETGRSANCKTFINKLSQLLNSLTLWASSDGSGANLTAEQRAREARYLQKGLETLESGLESAVKSACTEFSEELSDNIFDKYETAISNATQDAIDTAFKWGAPVNREDRAAGGLHWSTYKAICRRNGIYTNAQGPHEWNAQLAEPMLKILASGWEKTFTRRLPMVMASFSRNAATPLRKFHRDIEARARKIGSSIAGLHMLHDQVSAYENILKDLSTSVREHINATQKDVNREFTPVIERAMATAYEQCVDERGPGSFARMKAAMNSHVAHERHTMFQESADNVEHRLRDMIKNVEVIMSDKTDEVFNLMKRDYRSVIGGGVVPQDGDILPRDQRLVRKEIKKIIEGVEKVFSRVAGLSVDDEEDGAEGEDGQNLPLGQKAEPDKVKEEPSPFDQLADNEEEAPQTPVSRAKRAASANEATMDAASESGSETKLQSLEAQQRLEGLVPNKLDSDSDASNASNVSDID